MSYSIQLYSPVLDNPTGPIGNYTAPMRDWRDTTRAIGGYWIASATFWTGPGDPLVSLNDALEMFHNGMQRRVVRSVGGFTMWEGFLHTMTLTNYGRQHVRTFSNAANAIKDIYARMGGNLITNGSAELGLSDYNVVNSSGTPTISIETAWASSGTHSWHVDCTPCAAWGGGIGLQSGGTLTAGRTYMLTATINIDNAGVTIGCEIQVRVGGVTIHSIATPDGEMGVHSICESFEASATGTPSVRIIGDTDAGFYIDGVTLFEAGSRADTGWQTDDDSIELYGRIEEVLLDAGSTDEAAMAIVQRQLREKAWMWSTPPASDATSGAPVKYEKDGLYLQFAGYVQTLPWRGVATYGGVDTASNHITKLLADSEFVAAGDIATNDLSCYVEAGEAIRVWDEMEKIIRIGGTNGVQWMGGVYGGRKFSYEARPTGIGYYIRNGLWYGPDGNIASPETIAPAYVCDEDLFLMTGTQKNDPRDDPRTYWMDEVEFVAPDQAVPHYSEW